MLGFANSRKNWNRFRNQKTGKKPGNPGSVPVFFIHMKTYYFSIFIHDFGHKIRENDLLFDNDSFHSIFGFFNDDDDDDCFHTYSTTKTTSSYKLIHTKKREPNIYLVVMACFFSVF